MYKLTLSCFDILHLKEFRYKTKARKYAVQEERMKFPQCVQCGAETQVIMRDGRRELCPTCHASIIEERQADRIAHTEYQERNSRPSILMIFVIVVIVGGLIAAFVLFM